MAEDLPGTHTSSRSKEPQRAAAPTVPERDRAVGESTRAEPRSEEATPQAPSSQKALKEKENDPRFFEGLLAQGREVAREAAEVYDTARSAVNDAVRSTEQAILNLRASDFAARFPEKTITLPNSTRIALKDLPAYLKADSSQDPSTIHRALSEFEKQKKTALNKEAELLSIQENGLEETAQAARGNPEALREAADALDQLHAAQKTNQETLAKLVPTKANRGPASRLSPETLRDLAKQTERAKAKRAALGADNHPLRQKIRQGQEAVRTLEARQNQKGCLCKEEASAPYQTYQGMYQSQLCVLRSDKSGKPRVWMERYGNDCASDCARWMKDEGYTNLCATQSERREIESELTRARTAIQQSERALSAEESTADSALEDLTAWRPF